MYSMVPMKFATKLKEHFPKEIEVFFSVMSAFHLMLFGYAHAILTFLFPRHFPRARKDISGQTVLITGAGSGLGRQIAIEFSKHCARVVLLDLNVPSLHETKNLMDGQTETFLYECDVSKSEMVYDVAKRVKIEVGKVDILVNNAGIVNGQKFLDIPDETLRKTMEVNMLAHFWTCKAFLPAMMSANKGHVVSVCSQAGVSGLPRLTDYCASKFGAVGFMESLVLELAAQRLDGVKVTIVCPSLISTGLFEGSKPPLTVLMTPEYVAGEIMEAVLEDKEFLLLPLWSYLILLLKWTMPRCAVRRFYENSGLLEFMDTFQGRKVDTNENLAEKTL